MSVGTRVLVFVVKWLLVPVALGVIGFKVIGPQIGKSPAASTSVLDNFKKPEPVKAPSNTVATKKRYGEPEVEITVSKAERRRSSRVAESNRRERTESDPPKKPDARSEKRKEPEAKQAEPEQPTGGGNEDEGGSGGAAGAEPPPTTGGDGNGDGASIQNRHLG